MGLTTNQQKGNTAEYFVCHELESRGIRVWQLGGNNRRWDIVFQATADDDLVPGQVKARASKSVVFRTEDAEKCRAYYFICYAPTADRDRRFLARESENIL